MLTVTQAKKILNKTVLNENSVLHWKKYQQFVIYCMIGFTGATLDYIIYLILFNKLGVSPDIASFLSMSVSIVNNFIWNSKFNFKKTDNFKRRMISFYAVGIFGMILTSLVINITYYVFHFDANIVKLVMIPVIAVIQFILNKKISFKNF